MAVMSRGHRHRVKVRHKPITRTLITCGGRRKVEGGVGDAAVDGGDEGRIIDTLKENLAVSLQQEGEP